MIDTRELKRYSDKVVDARRAWEEWGAAVIALEGSPGGNAAAFASFEAAGRTYYDRAADLAILVQRLIAEAEANG
jgi:hypothetical protein